ncbi:MAG: hypothetical protein BROFUL_00308 [Candidatus Brocadia fulgida]|uniref:Uncharacterized protein n=1 Tax=Candidatus Brocadia fulgida TaxID=380242 RepID=A0A0M2UY03_9BACT|nr:MAG: hypothetical protein BROFUL_00308 [Candidatus Brocadia fulgida]
MFTIPCRGEAFAIHWHTGIHTPVRQMLRPYLFKN